MGAKIVSGSKAETTPIAGKRGHVDVKVQAARDAERVYFRFQWTRAAHTPASFVDGGKMDPQNEAKLSIMFSGASVENAQFAGCWVTCHHDARTMPDTPKADDPEGRSAGRTHRPGERRHQISRRIAHRHRREGKPARRLGQAEEQGRDRRPAGRGQDDGIAALALGRRAGTWPRRRRSQDERPLADFAATGGLDGDAYTVVISRPLKGAAPGETAFEPGKKYVVSFALHDDFANARFHHVSLAYEFALDGEAEIVAKSAVSKEGAMHRAVLRRALRSPLLVAGPAVGRPRGRSAAPKPPTPTRR
jgi:hypothetical protein